MTELYQAWYENVSPVSVSYGWWEGGAYERKGVVNECLSQVNSYGDFIIAVSFFLINDDHLSVAIWLFSSYAKLKSVAASGSYSQCVHCMCMETVEFWQLRVTNGAKTPLSYPLVSRFIHLFIHMLENIFDKSQKRNFRLYRLVFNCQSFSASVCGVWQMAYIFSHQIAT